MRSIPDIMVATTELLDFPKQRFSNVPSKLLYKNSATPNSFQQAMKCPLVLMQIFAFFPIKGVTGSNYKHLKFRWLSWRVLLCLVCLGGYIVQFVCFCAYTKVDTLFTLNAVFFHLEGVILSALFLILAMQWPAYVKEWHLVEISMKSYELSVNLKRRMISILVPIFSLALIEHIMVTVQTILSYLGTKKYPDDPLEACGDYFVNHQFREIFYYIPYYMLLGLFFQILIFQKTFIWTFIDVFIIFVSICFRFRLQQVTKKLTYMSKLEVSDENIWRSIRENFVKLSRLCDLTNKHLCWLIIISFFTNIYHILSQLFSSLRPIEDTFHKVYYYVSFFLLILRVSSVCIFGGAIFDEHEKITRILTTVPSAAYNIEVERFIMHLATCETALTGKNFFKITRNLILKVTSAIVTYELVLIQFNQREFKNRS